MADMCEITEVRNIASVICDQLPLFEKNLQTVQQQELEDDVTKVLLGERLVFGQLIFLKSTDGTNPFGVLPAIVTGVKRTTVTNVTYKLTMLTGDMNNELLTTEIEDTKIVDAVSIEEDSTNVLTGITSTKLGFTDLREMKLGLGIPHIFVLDSANRTFNSII